MGGFTLLNFECDKCIVGFNTEMKLVQHYLFYHGILRPMCGSKIETKLAKLVEELVFLRGNKSYIVCTHKNRYCHDYDCYNTGRNSSWYIDQSKIIIGLIDELKKEIPDFESIPIYKKLQPYICVEHKQVGISPEKVEKQLNNAFKMVNKWDESTAKLVKYAEKVKKQMKSDIYPRVTNIYPRCVETS